MVHRQEEPMTFALRHRACVSELLSALFSATSICTRSTGFAVWSLLSDALYQPLHALLKTFASLCRAWLDVPLAVADAVKVQGIRDLKFAQAKSDICALFMKRTWRRLTCSGVIAFNKSCLLANISTGTLESFCSSRSWFNSTPVSSILRKSEQSMTYTCIFMQFNSINTA